MNDTDKKKPEPAKSGNLSRRDFLRIAGVASAGGILAACRPAAKLMPDITPALHLPVAGSSPTFTSASIPSSTASVAIGRAANYDRILIRRQVEAIFDNLGGISDVIRSGSKVVIKTNLTGGNHFQAPDQSYRPIKTSPLTRKWCGPSVNWPATPGECGCILLKQFIMTNPIPCGVTRISSGSDTILININKPDPYTDFGSASVRAGSYFIQNFICHHILTEVDAFISVAKMKCHYNAGIALLDEEPDWHDSLYVFAKMPAIGGGQSCTAETHSHDCRALSWI